MLIFWTKAHNKVYTHREYTTLVISYPNVIQKRRNISQVLRLNPADLKSHVISFVLNRTRIAGPMISIQAVVTLIDNITPIATSPVQSAFTL